MKPGVVTVANEQVSIVTVCRMLGVEVDEDSLRIPKLHCPFEQMYHSDGGLEAAMRVYTDSNTAYCFSCTMKFTPVTLYALAKDILRRDAAVRLLDHIGYKPIDLAAAWQHATTFEPTPDRSQLADALQTFCRRVDPAWQSRQFDPEVAQLLSRCLSLLDHVYTGQDAQLWLSRCKDVMHQALPIQNPS